MTEKELIKRIKDIQIRSYKNVTALMKGNYISKIKGSGMIFHEARKYVYGDSIKKIDWNMTARMNEAYVKEVIDERERNIFIALDISPSMQTGWQEQSKISYAMEVASTIAHATLSSKDKLGYLFFSDKLHLFKKPKQGKKHFYKFIYDMVKNENQASQNPKGRCQFSDSRIAIHEIQKQKGKRFHIFIISDFIDYDVPEDIKFLQAKHQVSLLHIFDPLEYHQNNSLKFIVNSPEGEEYYTSLKTQDSYKLENIQKSIIESCKKYKINYQPLNTQKSVYSNLMKSNVFY